MKARSEGQRNFKRDTRADSTLFSPPTWVVRPRTEYPKAGLEAAVPGRVTVACIVDGQGLARLCQVDAETPSGFGFGDAVLATQPSLRFNPATIDNVPVESVVTFSQPFMMAPTIKPSAKLNEALDVIYAIGSLTYFCRAHLPSDEIERWSRLSADFDSEAFKVSSPYDQLFARAYGHARGTAPPASLSRSQCDQRIADATSVLHESGAKQSIGRLMEDAVAPQ